MDSEETRRHFLLGGSLAATAGLLASDLQAEEQHAQEHRDDHLDVVTDEVAGGRVRETVETHD